MRNVSKPRQPQKRRPRSNASLFSDSPRNGSQNGLSVGRRRAGGRFTSALSRAARRIPSDPSLGAAVLVIAGFGGASIALLLLPAGRPSYLTLLAIAAIGVSIYARWHGAGKAFKRLLAFVATVGVIAGITPIVSSYQRLLKRSNASEQVVKTFGPYGSPSFTVSKQGSSTIRTCPRSSCRKIASLPDGSKVTMRCWVDSQEITEVYRSPRWFKISFALGARHASGYIHSSNVQGQARTPHC